MKINDFEKAIDKMGLNKMEVRLCRGGNVHWFICSQNGSLVIFNDAGKAFVIPDFQFPEDISDLKIDTILHEDGSIDYTVNGIRPIRDRNKDLF